MKQNKARICAFVGAMTSTVIAACALWAVRHYWNLNSEDRLRESLQAGSTFQRVEAAEQLGALQYVESAPILIQAVVGDSEGPVVAAAVDALKRMGRKGAPALLDFLSGSVEGKNRARIFEILLVIQEQTPEMRRLRMALGSVSERIRLTEGTRGNVIWASYLLNTRKGGLYAFICPSVNGVATAIIITMSEQGMLQSWRAMETGFVFIDARVESQQGNVLVVLGRKSEGSVVTKRVLLSSSTIEIYEKSKTNAQDYNRGLELRETDVDTIRRQCLEWLNT